MKLTELIKFLTNSEQLHELVKKYNLNHESEALLIYMQEKISMESEIQIFEIEETEDEIIFEKDGIRYVQLFTLEHTISLIELDLDLLNKGYTDMEIAVRIIEYRLNDA